MDIKTMAQLIKKYPSPISELTRLAQAVHETGNFTSDIFKNANNSFGIKASAPWTGDSFNAKTGETVNGKEIQIRDNFRKYKTVEDCVADQALFFVSTSHRKNVAYKEAIEAKNYQDEAKALMGPGRYATDVPTSTSIGYAAKLLRTIDNYGLKNYGMKESASLKDIEETPKEETNKGEDIKMTYIGLDIGHGANTWETGGGKGVSTGGRVYEEHTFNSIVAKKLKTLLEKSGHKVTYGVQQPMANDTSLTARTNRFNAEKVDIMVSIHANWIGTFKNSTNGIGAFYANYDRDSRSTNSKKLADAIMAQYRKQGQTIYGAGSIPSVLTNWTNFHMTREVTMPAVLMELGFMSGTTDFDKIFGSQQDKYTTQMAEGLANGINAYFGMQEVPSGATPSTPATGGGGLDDVKWPAYKAPTQEFDVVKDGAKVKIRKGHSAWFIPNNPSFGKKPSKDFAGDTDTVVKSMAVNVSYSKRAYLLKNKVSWILEQDLEEPRANWGASNASLKTHTVKSGEYLYLIGEKYGITVANIKDWNGLSSNVIFSGQKLYVEDPSKKAQEPTKPLPPTDVVEAPKEEQPKDEGSQTPAVDLKDGEFFWEGKKYKITKA